MKSCPHCKEHKETNANLAEQLLKVVRENAEYKEFLDNILILLSIDKKRSGEGG